MMPASNTINNGSHYLTLGEKFYFGRECPVDFAMAYSFFRLAAKEGNAIAHARLGWMYECGQGCSKNPELAYMYFKLAADCGNAVAQFITGKNYCSGNGYTVDHFSALKYYQLAAAQGLSDAEVHIGDMYDVGLGGCPIDKAKALQYYRLAAEHRNTFALHTLGSMYREGKDGYPVDKMLAKEYFTLAADQRHSFSQEAIATLALMEKNSEYDSNGRPIDLFMTAKLTQLYGCRNALLDLAKMYEQGELYTVDIVTAIKFYQFAADLGDLESQKRVGQMYRDGYGVQQDLDKAIKYFSLAANHDPTVLDSLVILLEVSMSLRSPILSDVVNEGYLHSQHFDGEWKINIPQTSFAKAGHFSTCPLSPNNYPAEYQSMAYLLQPIQNRFDLNAIDLVQAPNMMRAFHHAIETCESRLESPAFQADVERLTAGMERKNVLSTLSRAPCLARHNRKVMVVKAWHGTSMTVARSIMNHGFAKMAVLDEGWFGGGIYFTSSLEYALRYCESKSDPCLMLCYLILFNPYPVVWEDAKSLNELVLEGKSSFRNFGCHYVPIAQYSANDFRPPMPGMQAQHDEIVIFQENHILPHALISLAPRPTSFPLSPPPGFSSPLSPKVPPSQNASKWSVEEVVSWVASLCLSKDYTQTIKQNNITGEVLLTLTKDDWREVGVTIFGDHRILTNKVACLK